MLVSMATLQACFKPGTRTVAKSHVFLENGRIVRYWLVSHLRSFVRGLVCSDGVVYAFDALTTKVEVVGHSHAPPHSVAPRRSLHLQPPQL